MVALSKALQPGAARSDEALLLRTMGDQAAAAEAAKTLPPGDPAGPYARFDAPGLAALAADKDAARAQYLELLDLARGRGPVRWWAAFRKSRWSREVNFASLKAIAELADFGSIQQTAAALTAAAFLQTTAGKAERGKSEGLWGPEAWPYEPLSSYLASAQARLTSPPEAQTRAFEEAAAHNAATEDGPLFTDSRCAPSSAPPSTPASTSWPSSPSTFEARLRTGKRSRSRSRTRRPERRPS